MPVFHRFSTPYLPFIIVIINNHPKVFVNTILNMVAFESITTYKLHYEGVRYVRIG